MKTNVLLTMLITALFLMPVITVCQNARSETDDKVHEVIMHSVDAVPDTSAKATMYKELSFGVLDGKPGGISSNIMDGQTIRYDNGTNLTAIGSSEGEVYAAAYFPASTMAQYAGMELAQVEIYIAANPISATLHIYGPGSSSAPGALIYSQAIATAANSWIMIGLDSPVYITGDDLWIGYKASHNPEFYPAGVDTGPAVAGYGDMASEDGVNWIALSDYGMDYNWNIAGYLEEGIICPEVYAGEDAVVCSYDFYNITDALATNFSMLQWTTNGDGFFDDNTILNPTYIPGPGDIANGNVELCLTAQPVPPCPTSATACMTLSFQAPPTVDAGADASINYTETYTLNASASDYAALLWETSGDGIFDQNNILNPVYTPGGQDILDGGVELTIFAEAISPCIGFADDYIFLTIANTPPLVEITSPVDGDEFNFSPILVEGTAFDAEGELDFVEVSVNYGPWQTATGTDNWSVEVQIAACNNIIKARATDIKGLQSLNDYVENIHLNPTVNAGPDQTICYMTPVVLNGFAENYESLQWFTTNGTGQIMEANSLQAYYIPGPGDEAIGDIEICLTAFGIDVCDDVTDCMILTIVSKPTADAGADATINCDESYPCIDASATNYSSLQWTTNGDGFFDDNTTLNTTYIPGPNDCTNCEVQLCLTAYPIDPCIDTISDCMVLFVMTAPPSMQPLGSGTETDPYLIATLENLYWISEQANNGETFSGVYFLQTADIDASGTENWFCGLGWNPIGGDFYGNYNGDCHAIESLYINRENNDCIGLFSKIRTGKVEKLKLLEFNVTGHKYVGALAGQLRNGAEVEYVDVENAQIQLLDQCGGGLIGLNYESSRIFRCSASGQITRGDAHIYNYVGGFVGDVGESAIVEECYCTTEVTSLNYRSIGGFAGLVVSGGEIKNSYSRGSVTALGQRVGGFVGHFGEGSVTNCFSTGLVTAPYSYVGGFAGYLTSGVCVDNFWDIETSNQPTSSCATGKTTTEMKTLSTFTDAGWDFENVWAMDGETNDGYPALKWQMTPVVYAGEDATISAGESYYLDGVAENYSVLLWSTNGDGTFSNPEILNPIYSMGEMDIQNGEIELCLTAYPVHPCLNSVTDCITLTIIPTPTVDAGPDDTVCDDGGKRMNGKGGCYQLNGNATNFSYVLWSTSGDGTFDEPYIVDAMYCWGNQDVLSGSVILTLTVYGKSDAKQNSDFMVLTIQRSPTADAGPDGLVCCGDVFTFEEATASNYTSLLWLTTNGTGDFTGETTLHASYLPSELDCIMGSVEICLTAEPIAPCTVADSDCMELVLQPNPIADAGADATITEGETYTLSGSAMNDAGVIWESSGNGDFDPPDILTPVYTPGSQDINAGFAELCLTAYPLSPCLLNGYDCMTLTIEEELFVDAGPDDTICTQGGKYPQKQDGCYQLNGSTSLPSYCWTTNGDGTFNNDFNILNPVYCCGVLDILNGSVTLTITQCKKSNSKELSDSMILTLQNPPTAYAGADTLICCDDSYTIADALATNYSDLQWFTPNGTGAFDDETQQNPTYSFGPGDCENDSIVLCLTANPINPCTVAAEDCMTIYLQNPPYAFAGEDASYCCQYYNMGGALAMNYSSLLWTTSGDGTFNNAGILNPDYYPGPVDRDFGIIELCLTAYPIFPCEDTAKHCMILNYFPYPYVDLGNDTAICGCEPFMLTQASAGDYSDLFWSTSGTGTFSQYDILHPVYYPSIEDCEFMGSVELCLSAVGIPPCGMFSSDCMILTFYPLPEVNCPEDFSVCISDQAFALSGASPAGGEYSGPGLSGGLFDPLASGAGEHTITYTYTDENGCTDSCTFNITVVNIPIANAGPDKTICCYELSPMIYGQVIDNCGQIWSTSGDGNFEDDNSPITLYFPGEDDCANGSVELCITAFPCNPCTIEASDCMTLTFQIGPTANAGEDATINQNESYTLSGLAENYTSAMWSGTGDGSFDNPAILSPVYTPGTMDKLNGEVELCLTANPISPCTVEATDCMTLTILTEIIVDAGPDDTVCVETTKKPTKDDGVYQLHGQVSVPYSSLLWTTSGSGYFNNDAILDPTYTCSLEDILEGFVILTLNVIGKGPSSNYSDFMVLTFQEGPTTDAGEDATICEGDSYELINAMAVDYSSLLWTSYAGTGTFSNPNILHPSYYPSMMDVLLDSVALCLSAAPIEPCSVGATDCMTLRIEVKPVANAGSDGTVCEDDPYQITGASIVGDYSAFIWISGGDGDFVNPFEVNPVYQPGDSDIEEGEVKLFLIVAPVSPCVLLGFDVMTLYIQYKPAVHAGEDATISCKPYLLSGAAENISSFAWASSGNGGFINETTLYPTYTPSPDDCNTGTVEICLTGQPLFPCLIEAIDCITLELIPAPFVDAGPDIRICGCDNVLEITEAVAANFETVYWGTEGSGVFSDNYMLNPSYIPGMEDCLNRRVKLYIYATPLFPNTEIVKDSLTIYFDCVWVKDCENDDGTEPSYSNCPHHNSIWGWWRSPDIWVDNEGHGTQCMIQPGMINQVFVKARKFGSGQVENVHVDLYYKKQSPFFFHFPSGATQIPPGKIISIQDDFEIIQFSWYAPELPGLIKNYVIGSVLHVPVDDEVSSIFPARDNNKALISIRRLYTRVGQPIPKGNESAIEPTITYFLIGNPYDAPGELILDALIDAPQDWTIEFFDATAQVIELPYQVSLAANEEQTMKMIVTPNKYAQHGDEGQVAVMQFEADGFPDSEAITGAITFPIKVDLYPPAAITDLEVMASDGIIELHWTPVSLDVEANQENIACYNIYWGSSPDFVPGIENRLGRLAVDQNEEKPGFQWYDDDINKATLYYIVRVEDEAGYESENSNIVSISKFYDLNIVGGWSGISSYFIPDNIVIEDMFNPIINELIILYNNQGDLFWPEQGINSIINWDVYMGYAIKASNELTLNMGGQPVTNKIVPLLPGWNIIPVLSKQAYPVEDLFADKSNLQIVKEVAGTGVYWPDYSINTLGNVLPGKAYYARMNATDSIDYAVPAKGLSTIKPPDVSSLLTPWNQITQSPSSHLVVFELTEKALQDNDIIGGFSPEGLCVGLTKIQDASLPFAITLNGDDPYFAEKVGFNSGELLAFRLFRAAAGEVFDLEVSYKPVYDQSGLFVPNGMTVVNDIKLSPTGITNSSAHDVNIYPNPNDGTFTIEGRSENVDIRIIDLCGLEVYHDYVNLPAKVNISTQPKGLYFIRLEAGNRVYFEKLIKN